MEINKNSLYDRPDIYDVHFSAKISTNLGNHYKSILEGKEIKTIHDCSYGTGNLTNELARIGYTVSGSDISDNMLKQAKAKNDAEGLDINLTQSDFRYLTSNIEGQFDCVMSTGNSLGHVPNEDAKITLKEMAELVKPGGYLYLDTRNWDQILETKQRFYFYPPYFREEERVNVIQVWDYNIEGTITFNILYAFEKENKIYKREEFKETYHPIKKQFLIEELTKLDFKDIELWNMVNHQVKEFKDMEWYALICKKGV